MYEGDYHAERHRRTLPAARRILGAVRELLPPVDSAVDVGCGVGTFLSVLREEGVGRIRGLDGAWVEPSHLVIAREEFLPADLGRSLPDPVFEEAPFDLALCLEVAEHLDPDRAPGLVEDLARLSDAVLFSAAVPGQGGEHHVNERWPEYWTELFRQQGFEIFDCLRGRLWRHESVPFWYRQNLLLLARGAAAESARRCRARDPHAWPPPLSIIHPDLWEREMARRDSLHEAWRNLRRNLRRRWKRWRGGGGREE